jgi:hypothetical protein
MGKVKGSFLGEYRSRVFQECPPDAPECPTMNDPLKPLVSLIVRAVWRKRLGKVPEKSTNQIEAV